MSEQEFDTVGFCIALESGELDETAIVEGFQELINSGVAYQLQGSYQRTADSLIDAGLCSPKQGG